MKTYRDYDLYQTCYPLWHEHNIPIPFSMDAMHYSCQHMYPIAELNNIWE